VAEVEALGGDAVLFGEPFEFEDGLAVKVSRPREFTPSRGATAGDDTAFVRFTVDLINNSGRRISPGDVSVTVTSGGGQGGEVRDKKRQLTGPPARSVKPGGRITWVQGFGVLDPNDVAVVVQAGLNRVPIAVTG
jgi:hypothetical protein